MARPKLHPSASVSDVLPIIFPTGRDIALPVTNLARAVEFYGTVFDMTQVDTGDDPPYTLLRRDQFQLAVYEVPGYVSHEYSFPVLSVTTNAHEFDALRGRVRLHGGRITRDVVRGEPIPRFLFTDPDGSNLLECRAHGPGITR